jgi:hypothetical protein
MANTTFNPSDKSTRITLSGSNLIATNNFGIAQACVRAVDRQVGGKLYWEYTYNTVTSAASCGGIASQTWDINTTPASGTSIPGSTGLSQSGNVYAAGSATLSVDGGSVVINFGAITSGTVVCVAVDLINRLIWYRLGAGGNWNNSAARNPVTGVGGVFVHSVGVGIPLYPIVCCGTLNDQITANFGDTAFVGAVPSGYTSGFTAAPAATWNPADISGATLSGGNLIATAGAGFGGARGIVSQTSGKYYWEYAYSVLNSNSIACGIALSTANLAAVGTGMVYIQRTTGNIIVNASASGSTLGIISASAVLGIAVDFSSQLIWMRKAPAGSWNGSGTADPATGVGGVSFSAVSGALFAYMTGQAGDQITANFGATGFSGVVPAGFTSGLPAPGASVPTNAIASQALAEHWLTTNPQAQITQVILEHWMSVAEGTPVVPSLDTRVMVLA